MNQLAETSKKFDGRICLTIWAEKSKNKWRKINKLVEKGANIYNCSCHVSPIYFALKLQNYKIVNDLLNRGARFGIVQTTGPLPGFTALHHALLNDEITVASDLITKYKVNPTVEADDGVQPIHLAVLRKHYDLVFDILDSGVNIETELSYSYYKKYAEDVGEWNHNFGDKMSLFTYIFFNNKFYKVNNNVRSKCNDFLRYNPKCKIRDKNNKTLLMYAIEYHLIYLAINLIVQCSVKELNEKDNSGFTAVHYVVSPVKDKDFYEEFDDIDWEKRRLLNKLIECSANSNLMINNDPKTLPLHLAAYHRFPEVLRLLLDVKRTFFTPLTRPLFYAIQEEINSSNNGQLYRPLDDPRIIKTTEVIIGDIYRRTLCKFPVHEEEIKLMEQVVKSETVISEFLEIEKEKCNEAISILKNVKISFGTKDMTYYEVLMLSQKEYWNIARGTECILVISPSFCKFFHFSFEITAFCYLIYDKFYSTKEQIRREKILEKWEETAYYIITSLVLPYDCLSRIIGFLDFDDIESFADAFLSISR